MNFSDLSNKIKEVPRIFKINDIEEEGYRRRINLTSSCINCWISTAFGPKENVVIAQNGECFEIFRTTWGEIDNFVSVLPEFDNIELEPGMLFAPLIQWEQKYESAQILAMLQDLHLFCEEIRTIYKSKWGDNEILKAFGLC